MQLLKRLACAFFGAAFALGAIAQSLPTLPGNSVVGRLSTSTGPAEAIPLGTLGAALTLNASSVTSLTIGTGAQTFTTQAGLPVVVGELLLVASTNSLTNYISGPVTAYNLGTGSLTINVNATSGSGTFTSWTITGSGPAGATGATGAAGGLPIGAAGGTVDAITSTIASVTLTDKQFAAVVSAGVNTLSNPTFAPNALTAHTITARGGLALNPGDIGAAGYVALLEYNLANTRWELQNPVQVAVLRGYLSGCTLSNDSGTPTTILDVAACYAADSTNASMITVGAFTKSTGGTWVAGSGGNGMGQGLTIANTTWYHVFAIINAGVADIYFDTSASAGNKPTNTTAFRRIGSFLTDGSAHIITFVQYGELFEWKAPVLESTSANPGTNAVTQTLANVPTGVNVIALMNANLSGAGANAYFSDLATTDAAVSSSAAPGTNLGVTINVGAQLQIMTNTSAQIRTRISSSGGGQQLVIVTTGWRDRRGRDD